MVTCTHIPNLHRHLRLQDGCHYFNEVAHPMHTARNVSTSALIHRVCAAVSLPVITHFFHMICLANQKNSGKHNLQWMQPMRTSWGTTARTTWWCHTGDKLFPEDFSAFIYFLKDRSDKSTIERFDVSHISGHSRLLAIKKRLLSWIWAQVKQGQRLDTVLSSVGKRFFSLYTSSGHWEKQNKNDCHPILIIDPWNFLIQALVLWLIWAWEQKHI